MVTPPLHGSPRRLEPIAWYADDRLRPVGTREQAEAAPDPSPDRSRSRRLVASSQPTGSQARPGQEVGRRARALSWWRWARDPSRTPRRDGVKQRRRGGSWLWLQVLGGSRAGARRLLGWRIHGGGWEDGWPACTNRAQTGQLGGFKRGPGEQQQLPNCIRLQRHHEAFFNGRAWNYIWKYLKIESGVLL